MTLLTRFTNNPREYTMAADDHSRFQTTLESLRDCHAHLSQPVTDAEAQARRQVLDLCKQMVADAHFFGLIETTDLPWARDEEQVLIGPIAAPAPKVEGPVPAKMLDGGRPVIEAYIDGACSGNPGPGGWGVVVVRSDGTFHEISGSSQGDTTNNRMELQAAVELLARLPANAQAHIHADSQYVVKGMTEWMQGWKRNAWRTSSKKEVQNIDLWLRLDALSWNKDLHWHWVRGHNGHPGNERADQIAVAACQV